MATKVFISWGGELSEKLAEALRKWLPSVLQFVKPYFTPNDVEKGSRWATDIQSELSNSDIGIICLTKDNIDRPWILFESGALSKNFDKAKVCTLLFGINSADLKGPLTIFQYTLFIKSDFKKLVKVINSSGGDSKLEEGVLDEVFEMWWPLLEKQVHEILHENESTEEESDRSDRDILEEILELSRLSTRETRRSSNSISPGAILALSESYSLLAEAIERQDWKLAQKYLVELLDPIEYFCRKTHLDSYLKIQRSFIERNIFSPNDSIDSTEEQ